MKNIKPVVSVFKKKVNSFVKKSPPIGGPTLSPGKLEIRQYLRMLPYKFYTIESTDTQFLIFLKLAIWFLKNCFKDFHFYSYVKEIELPFQLWHKHTHGEHH